MATQVETSNQSIVPRNMGLGTYGSRDSVSGPAIPGTSGTVLSKGRDSGLASVEPPDDCCGIRSKFCLAREAGLARIGLEHPELFDKRTPARVQKIFRTIYRITRNREDTEDALQDAFLQALVHFEDFDGRSAFSTWFTRIAINCSLMILRKRKNCRTVSLDDTTECEESKAFQQATDPEPDAEKRYLQAERATALRDAINELRPSLRVAVELTHFAERSIHETADTLAVSLGATKSRLFHARVALRNSQKLRRFHNTDLKTNWSCQTT